MLWLLLTSSARTTAAGTGRMRRGWGPPWGPFPRPQPLDLGDLDGAPLGQGPLGGQADQDRGQAVVAGDRRGLVAIQRLEEGLHLVHEGLLVPLQEEVERLVPRHPLLVRQLHRRGGVVGRRRAPLPTRTPPPAGRIRRTPSASCRSPRSAPLAKVSVTTAVSTSPAFPIAGSTSTAPLAYTSTTSLPDRYRAMSKSWMVMSRKIPPETFTYSRRRRRRVARRDPHDVRLPHRPRLHQLPHPPEVVVEPPVEADLQLHLGLLHRRQRPSSPWPR